MYSGLDYLWDQRHFLRYSLIVTHELYYVISLMSFVWHEYLLVWWHHLKPLCIVDLTMRWRSGQNSMRKKKSQQYSDKYNNCYISHKFSGIFFLHFIFTEEHKKKKRLYQTSMFLYIWRIWPHSLGISVAPQLFIYMLCCGTFNLYHKIAGPLMWILPFAILRLWCYLGLGEPIMFPADTIKLRRSRKSYWQVCRIIK